ISVPDNAATDPAIPPGYQFDFVCRDMLLNDFVAKDGALATKSGMHYQVLVLPASAKKLTLPVLKKLRAFVAGGVTVIGARPTGSPSLGDGDAQVAALIAELWDGGKISAGPLADVLAARHIEPSFTFTGADKIVALHRTLADGELFFIANQDAAPAHVQARPSSGIQTTRASSAHRSSSATAAPSCRSSSRRTNRCSSCCASRRARTRVRFP